MASESKNRDLRIDVIRGLSLWMIFVDHVPGDLLAHITYRHFGFSDAVDIFVFLAGISSCLLYGRLLQTAGFVHAQMRALRRVFQIYIGHICVGVATVASFFAFRHVLDQDYIVANGLTLLANVPERAIGAMLWLYHTPQYMGILPFYMVFIAAAPSLLLLFRRSEATALLASGALWLLAAAFPQLDMPSLDASAISFNPFSWQILFCLGLWVGKRHYIDRVPFRPRRWLKALCWLLVIAGAAADHDAWFGLGDWAVFAQAREAHLGSNEQLIPLIDFLAGAYLTASYLPAGASLLRSTWIAPLRVCGRHSLEVFCVGVGASLLGDVVLRLYGQGLATQLAVNVAGFAAMTAIALFKERRRAGAIRSLQESRNVMAGSLGDTA